MVNHISITNKKKKYNKRRIGKVLKAARDRGGGVRKCSIGNSSR